MAESITERFETVNSKIDDACRVIGRNRSDVKLITVTKGHSSQEIIEVLNAGASILGENYPEETLIKIEEIESHVSPLWHMIGHLQSRKIKLMYPQFSCIQSIDSVELAVKIDRFYEEKNTKLDVLFEVNISGEESKFGFDASNETKRDALLQSFYPLFSLKNIRPVGLMTMPPSAVEPSQNEACYNLCRLFCERIASEFGLNGFNQLSMGTSADFEMAVKCGATYIRVGEAIMGKRLYPTKQ